MTGITDKELDTIDLDWLQEQVDDISTIRDHLDRQLAAEGLVLSGEIDDLIAEVRRLRAIIGRLDAMHQPEEYGGGSAEYADGVGCTTCEYVDWPCEIHTALHPVEDR